MTPTEYWEFYRECDDPIRSEILDALAVIPIAWLRAQDIVGEMNLVGDGRLITSELRILVELGLIIREGSRPIYYRLCPNLEEHVEEAWARRADERSVEKLLGRYVHPKMA